MREMSDTLLLIMQAGSMGVSLTLFLVLVLSCLQKGSVEKYWGHFFVS